MPKMAWNRSPLYDVLAQGASNRDIMVCKIIIVIIEISYHFQLLWYIMELFEHVWETDKSYKITTAHH